MKKIALLLFLVTCLLGCQTVTTPQRGALSSSDTRAVSPPPIDQKEEQAERLYRRGVEAVERRDLAEARFYFEAAIGLLLQSNDPEGETDLPKNALQTLMEQISRLDRETLGPPTDIASGQLEPIFPSDPGPPPPILREDLRKRVSPRRGESSEEVTYDIPIVLNEEVRRFIHLFRTERKPFIEKGLERSGRYLPMIWQIFSENDLPLDLAYLALVESNFKPLAYSRARAKGIWQFIYSTGKIYGLSINWWVDERSDPEKATRACVRYLKKLYGDYGDWYLALAAYNGGEARVNRAIRRVGSSDFWRLAKSPYLKRETKNYVPAVLAAIVIGKNPERYGLSLEYEPPWEFSTLAVDSPVQLSLVAELAGVSYEEMKRLNPELRRAVTPPYSSTYPLRVPKGKAEHLQAKLGEIPDADRAGFLRYRVRRGDTVYQLARRYRTSVQAISQANSLRNPNRLRPGQQLLIPYGSTRARIPRSNQYAVGEKIKYRVRRGDTVYEIARRFRTSTGSIISWNNLNNRGFIRSGDVLTIYYGQRADTSSGQKITYRVKKGDTLYGIAKLFQTTVQNLRRWNGIGWNEYIYPGDRLTIFK